jgi:hypothetical protein
LAVCEKCLNLVLRKKNNQRNNTLKLSFMIITFNELRRIKDRLPSGSSQRIADELGLDVETVRNYFGGKHFDAKGSVGVHFEQGPDGGVVTLDDTAILDAAMRILNELEK